MIQLKEMTVAEVKKLLDTLPDDETLLLLTLNFDNNEKVSGIGEIVNKDGIGIIAQKAKTIIYYGDKSLSHVDMHSVRQTDIYNIQTKGILKTILLDNSKIQTYVR